MMEQISYLDRSPGGRLENAFNYNWLGEFHHTCGQNFSLEERERMTILGAGDM